MLASLRLHNVDIPPQSCFPRKQSQDARCGSCLNLAPNGPASRRDECLLIGVKQTQCGHAATSESDPKQTSAELVTVWLS
jgi:hypothetical protein